LSLIDGERFFNRSICVHHRALHLKVHERIGA
jgi:hypothetical protein